MNPKILKPSRIYWAIVNPDRVRRTPGRDGVALKAKPIRVPRDIGQELDLLIQNWKEQCDTTSPRYHFAKILLSELEQLFPEPPQDE